MRYYSFPSGFRQDVVQVACCLSLPASPQRSPRLLCAWLGLHHGVTVSLGLSPLCASFGKAGLPKGCHGTVQWKIILLLGASDTFWQGAHEMRVFVCLWWLEVVLSGSRSRWCYAPRLLVNSCPRADSVCWCCCPLSCVLCHPCLVGTSVSLPPPFPLLSTHAWTQGPWALTPCSFSCRDGCWLLPADLVKVIVEKREWRFSGWRMSCWGLESLTGLPFSMQCLRKLST